MRKMIVFCLAALVAAAASYAAPTKTSADLVTVDTNLLGSFQLSTNVPPGYTSERYHGTVQQAVYSLAVSAHEAETNFSGYTGSVFFVSNFVWDLNDNFSLVSNDFAVTKAYLLGGGVTNQYGTNYWSSNGAATNSALVPALQYNQGIYATNFHGVNSNTFLTTNLFALLGQLLDIGSYTNETSSGSYTGVLSDDFANWNRSFSLMNTNFTALPTNLVYSFPSLFHLFDTNIVRPFVIGEDNDVRAEVFAILAELGYIASESFTYVPGKYGFSSTSTLSVASTNVQLYTVPGTNVLAVGQTITIHAWGGGSSNSCVDGGCGGYAAGTLTNVAPEDYDDSVASHITNGMVLAVQVGPACGRAAVWRAGTNGYFHTMTNELVVAGGAGGGTGSDYVYGGFGGGTNGGAGSGVYSCGGGGGAAQNAGGAAGSSGRVGHRVWGARADSSGAATWRVGGDGYYGGGSVGSCSGDSGGGGGSGYAAPSLIDPTTYDAGGRVPPNIVVSAGWGDNAGYQMSPGRVSFVRRLAPVE